MKMNWINRLKLSVLIVGLTCIGIAEWRLNSWRTPMPHHAGVWDLGLIPMDSRETSIIASRSLSNWVQSRKDMKQFVLKWQYPDPWYPDPSPTWYQNAYIYNRSSGTLKIWGYLDDVGAKPGCEYGNVTDEIISQVANRWNSTLLDSNLLRQLGCSFTDRDIHTGEKRTFPPL
jgi:hypothetical protein